MKEQIFTYYSIWREKLSFFSSGFYLHSIHRYLESAQEKQNVQWN